MTRALSRRQALGGALGLTLGSLAARSSYASAAAPAPVLYISHGAPLFAVHDTVRIAELRAWGSRLPKPRGIVVMTPHYGRERLEVGATGRGFAMFNLPPQIKRRVPRELDYPTPPSEELAIRLDGLLGGGALLRRGQRRGFDHTTWMPLLCLYPAADVPVLELSYPYAADAELFALGRKLAPLRDEGVLFVASGQMTHNLAAFDPDDETVPGWSKEFDAWATEAVEAEDVDTLVDWRRKAPAQDLAHPDDGGHYRVLLVAMGVAVGGSRPARDVRFPVTGFEAALSKRCVEVA